MTALLAAGALIISSDKRHFQTNHFWLLSTVGHDYYYYYYILFCNLQIYGGGGGGGWNNSVRDANCSFSAPVCDLIFNIDNDDQFARYASSASECDCC